MNSHKFQARISWYFWKKYEPYIGVWYFFVNNDIHLQSKLWDRSWYLVSLFFCEIMIRLVLAHHFLWINCEISDFLWILDISSKFIFIHDRMYPLSLRYDRSEECFDEFDTHCCYFFVKSLNYLWNRWIICEQLLFFVNLLEFQVKP